MVLHCCWSLNFTERTSQGSIKFYLTKILNWGYVENNSNKIKLSFFTHTYIPHSSAILKLTACWVCVRTSWSMKQVWIGWFICLCVMQDSNMRGILGPRFLIQRGCTYDKVEYHTAFLPGCPFDSDPVFTYPVALSCRCGACRTDSDECTHRASTDGATCTKPVRGVYPYPGQSNYMIPFWFFSVPKTSFLFLQKLKVSPSFVL